MKCDRCDNLAEFIVDFEPVCRPCRVSINKVKETMDINKILQKVQELDEVIKEQGFYRDSQIDIETKGKKEPNFGLIFRAPCEGEEDE